MKNWIHTLFGFLGSDAAPATKRVARLGLESMDERAVPAAITAPTSLTTTVETRAIIIEGGLTARGIIIEGGLTARGIIIEGGLAARGIISIN